MELVSVDQFGYNSSEIAAKFGETGHSWTMFAFFSLPPSAVGSVMYVTRHAYL